MKNSKNRFKKVIDWSLFEQSQITSYLRNLIEDGILKKENVIKKFYNDIGVKCKIIPKPEEFVNGHNIGAYGDLIIQATHNPEASRKIEAFFKKYKNVADAKLADLIGLVTEKIDIKMTVIKDPLLAGKIREDILKKFKK